MRTYLPTTLKCEENMSSIFTKIINGQLPSYKIHEDNLTISILTIAPIQLGHTLIIPKTEVNHWIDVNDE